MWFRVLVNSEEKSFRQSFIGKSSVDSTEDAHGNVITGQGRRSAWLGRRIRRRIIGHVQRIYRQKAETDWETSPAIQTRPLGFGAAGGLGPIDQVFKKISSGRNRQLRKKTWKRQLQSKGLRGPTLLRADFFDPVLRTPKETEVVPVEIGIVRNTNVHDIITAPG